MKKVTIKNAKGLLSNALDNSKQIATKANDYALNTTETVVTESLEITAQWQQVADKALRGGFQLAENQQDIFFDILTEVKGHVKRGKKRFSKLVA